MEELWIRIIQNDREVLKIRFKRNTEEVKGNRFHRYTREVDSLKQAVEMRGIMICLSHFLIIYLILYDSWAIVKAEVWVKYYLFLYLYFIYKLRKLLTLIIGKHKTLQIDEK